MGADKYKVEMDNKFLGYYPAKDEEQAVQKAINKLQQLNCEIGSHYTVTRHGISKDIYKEC